jgi:general secretion pathway protein A
MSRRCQRRAASGEVIDCREGFQVTSGCTIQPIMATVYQDFYGLRELPFELMSHARFLFFTAGQREALRHLEYGLLSSRGITLLLGEAGTGKTTLLRACLERERCRHLRCVHLQNPTLTRSEFIEMLAVEFELGPAAAISKTTLLRKLETALRATQARGHTMALVIDEAQGLSDELLGEIRLLANIGTVNEKLLTVVVAGQPELATRLNQPELREFKQRVAIRCGTAPLTLRETAAYVAWRIRTAGSDGEMPFTREAVSLIHEASRGIPRTINVMCDNALLSGFALGRNPVDRKIVDEVCQDFDLRQAGQQQV